MSGYNFFSMIFGFICNFSYNDLKGSLCNIAIARIESGVNTYKFNKNVGLLYRVL